MQNNSERQTLQYLFSSTLKSYSNVAGYADIFTHSMVDKGTSLLLTSVFRCQDKKGIQF